MKDKRREDNEFEKILRDNPAKSLAGTPKSGYNKKKNNTISKRIGIVLSVIQLIVSCVFLGALFVLNMLSIKYMAIIAGVLLVLFLIVFVGQMLSKKKAIIGKLFSILITVILMFGSYYVFKMNATMETITESATKVNNIVVAVLVDDPAETIQDASDYNFGVQYAFKGEEITETVDVINTELGKEIATTQYTSVLEQAYALQEGEVEAIIYNEAYNSILEDEIEGYEDAVKFIYTCSIEEDPEEVVKEEPVEIDDDTFAMYISGIDVYGNIGTTSRSDVNIIAVVNTETHQILLITTPRDYYVPIPGVSGGVRDKLTHAGIYGVEASIATLEELYDMNIDFYTRVNFTSVVKIVDALGGISVYSNQSFSTGKINVVEGYNNFNGEQALSFARERHNVDGGDFQRGKNQQEVIKGMIRKAISPAILVGANEILNSVSGNVDTNMSTEQIQTLIKDQLDTGASWNIKTMAAVGTGDKQTCYSIPSSYVYVAWPDETSVNEIKAAITAVENGELLEGSDVAE